MGDAARKLDEDLFAVIESAERPPRCAVTRHVVAKIYARQIHAGGDGLRRLSLGILAAECDELILRILPGYRGHVSLLGRTQLKVIGPRIGVDDEVGHQFRPRRLDEDVDLLGRARAALGVAYDPAHGVAGRYGTGANECLSGLQGNVGDLTGGGIHLVERAFDERIDLDGVDEAIPDWLHARSRIGLIYPYGGIGGFWRGFAVLTDWLQLSRQRQHLRQLNHFDWRGWIGSKDGGSGFIVGDLRRLHRRGAAGERGGAEQ